MPSLRRSGGTNRPAAASLTTRSPIAIEPVSLRSSPATMRKVVVLPQPEGPSRVTNSPCSIARSMPSTAFTSPKCRRTWSRATLGMALLEDLLGELEHGVLPLGHGGAERLGGEQRPHLFDSLLDHVLDDGVVARVGVDDLLLGREIEVHEQPRGVGMRRLLQH